MADAVESGGRALLVSELGRVQDLVRQLEQQLRAPADAASVDLCRRLVHQIVALTDHSIGMLRASPADLAPSPPLSATGSPISGGDATSDHHHHHPFRAAGASPKKRKATARWTSQQVRVSAAGGGAEGPADDGHSWRKYGQKDILGAKHPRAYYRCTHRNSQNCPATKQVQRADDHPALFDVVYHGEHTCRPPAAAGGSGGAKRAQQQQHNPHAQAALQGLAARLTVATTTAAAAAAAAAALPPMTPESCPVRGASSPWSPVGSDSNGCLQHQGVSPCPVPGYGDWAPEGDLQEVVSSAFAAVSSAAPLPVLDDEFMSLECFAFDHNFDIDTAMPSLYYP
ncbi:probable WRKY transcription factor 41 [Sorghum bicolor]|jgi:hypothetical protein|uniref:WRKY domain-containing protein n=1 Tax=Sorghum bicolor TaxID=4558 RepID=A0A1Z5RAB5_SORBI|nr:probable WRKY transcription factor 41 [Sorghum bicolor]OQU80381.1 hypothetical protein SORBI_3007G118301 [Sorghum bicolor]|eukprot:XP_002444278.1 probable WRKY transcription factor 41 [Sorghum bicolor]